MSVRFANRKVYFEDGCLDSLSECGAHCCYLQVSLTFKEVTSGQYEMQQEFDPLKRPTELEKQAGSCYNYRIVLKTKEDNSCVYLTKDNKCSIYDRRPTVCKLFDCKKTGWKLTL